MKRKYKLQRLYKNNKHLKLTLKSTLPVVLLASVLSLILLFISKADIGIEVGNASVSYSRTNPLGKINKIYGSFHYLPEECVPNQDTACKSYKYTYMDYRKVTCTKSNQYKLLNSDNAWTDYNTGLRMINDCICIAIGTGYNCNVGEKVNIILENGYVIRGIVGDIKSDSHTDDTHKYQKYDGSVVEMIMDGRHFSSTKQYPDYINGRVLAIRKTDCEP